MVWKRAWIRMTALTLAVVWLAGCASNRIDWASRVGTYNYDQAVLEFGPPDKQAKLQNGTLVVEWLTRRGYAYAYSPFGYGYAYGWYPYYPGPIFVDTFQSPDCFLRLVFSPDGHLQSWKKFYR